jgi:hypothetical protein
MTIRTDSMVAVGAHPDTTPDIPESLENHP